MLHMFLGQSKTSHEPWYRLAIEEITGSIARLESYPISNVIDQEKYDRLITWCKGFTQTLCELEQSMLCCVHFANQVNCGVSSQEEISSNMDYQRFVYFYKNALIRVFSLLDKAGYFLNELFQLQTQLIKPRFSYFTMLRQLEQFRQHEKLYHTLEQLKHEFQETLFRLRDQRNSEIHYTNIELITPLMEQDVRLCHRFVPELVSDHLKDLHQGFQMVCFTMIAIFQYTSSRDPKRERDVKREGDISK